jgi:hypothetical protein
MFRSHQPLRSNQTQRAAGRMPDVFRFAKDGESKNPRNAEALDLPFRGKVLSFAYFSLHEQRKVGRASARNRSIFAIHEKNATKSLLQEAGVVW